MGFSKFSHCWSKIKIHVHNYYMHKIVWVFGTLRHHMSWLHESVIDQSWQHACMISDQLHRAIFLQAGVDILIDFNKFTPLNTPNNIRGLHLPWGQCPGQLHRILHPYLVWLSDTVFPRVNFTPHPDTRTLRRGFKMADNRFTLCSW